MGDSVNEEDLRDCFAMFAMTGWLMNGDYTKEEIPRLSYDMADAMLEARNAEPEEGIVAIKKRVRKTR
jgi:hypothetical protein